MKARWVGLSLIFFGIVINYIDRGSLSVAAPSMMRDFRITPATMRGDPLRILLDLRRMAVPGWGNRGPVRHPQVLRCRFYHLVAAVGFDYALHRAR